MSDTDFAQRDQVYHKFETADDIRAPIPYDVPCRRIRVTAYSGNSGVIYFGGPGYRQIPGTGPTEDPAFAKDLLQPDPGGTSHYGGDGLQAGEVREFYEYRRTGDFLGVADTAGDEVSISVIF